MKRDPKTITEAVRTLNPNGLRWHAERSLSWEVRDACRTEMDRRRQAPTDR